MLLKQVVPRGAVNFFTFKKKENVEMKKLLFISIVVFLVACDDTASSQDQYFANLPQEKYSSSSFENIEESSSSQAPVVSLSSGTVEESSSSEVSSSSQEAAQGSEKQIPKLDKLPFDTTGIKPQYISYTIDPAHTLDITLPLRKMLKQLAQSCTFMKMARLLQVYLAIMTFQIAYLLFEMIHLCSRMLKIVGALQFGDRATIVKRIREKLWSGTMCSTLVNLKRNYN